MTELLLLFSPLFLPLIGLLLCGFLLFLVFRAIEVPWSELKPLAEEKDHIVLIFGAERYPLELSSLASNGIQQYLGHKKAK